MFNFWSTAIIVEDNCFMFESTVVVLVEHLLILLPPLLDSCSQVLDTHLDVVVAGKMMEQRWRVKSQQSEPVLVTESHLEVVF